MLPKSTLIDPTVKKYCEWYSLAPSSKEGIHSLHKCYKCPRPVEAGGNDDSVAPPFRRSWLGLTSDKGYY